MDDMHWDSDKSEWTYDPAFRKEPVPRGSGSTWLHLVLVLIGIVLTCVIPFFGIVYFALYAVACFSGMI